VIKYTIRTQDDSVDINIPILEILQKMKRNWLRPQF